MADMTRWKIEVRHAEDDHVERTISPAGIPRHKAVKVIESIETTLDHDRFYAELVEIGSI